MPEPIQQAFVILVCILGAIAAIVGIPLLIDFASPVRVRTSSLPEFELGKPISEFDKSLDIPLSADETLRAPIISVSIQEKETDSALLYRLINKVNPSSSAQQRAEYVTIILRMSQEYNIDPFLIAGVIVTESTFKPSVKNYNGTCHGSMQVSKRYWDEQLREAGIIEQPSDYYDITKGIRAGVYVLNHYLSRSKTVQEALHKYSGGATNYYAKVMRHSRDNLIEEVEQ